MVAYAYAAAHPDEVRRLALCESLIPGFGLEELMNPATGGYWHFGFHMQVDIAEMLTKGKEADYLNPMWQMMSPVQGAEKAAVAEYLALLQPRPAECAAAFSITKRCSKTAKPTAPTFTAN